MEPQELGSGGPSNSSRNVQRLPPEALTLVMGAVPQQQRLASCALVCRDWRDAALAATTQLELTIPPDQRHWTAQVSAWLGRHGSGLHSLSVATSVSSHYGLLELPWVSLRQLRSLSLQRVQISCSSSSSSSSNSTAGTAGQPGPSSVQQLAQLTSLTSLVLKDCTISSGVLDLYQQQLPALRQLQELGIQFWYARTWTADGLTAALAAALPGLTALTRLHAVVTPDDAAAVISSLSSLPRLQDLGLQGGMRDGGDDTDPSISWSDVPASVTALKLSGTWQLQPAQVSHVAHAAQHSGQAWHDATSGGAVPGMPQLRQLHISHSWPQDVASTRSLLAALAQQQQLQSLRVDCSLTLPEGQTQHFAALAASSQLTALSLTVAGQIPASAVVSAMFGAGRRLPLLQRFDLWNKRLAEGIETPWVLGPQDVSRLLKACPGLRELEFLPATSDAAVAAAAAAGVSWSDVAAAAAAQLTKLEVVGSGDVATAPIAERLAQLA